MQITVDYHELQTFATRLEKMGKKTPANIKRGLVAIGNFVQGKAVAYAPRSQTKAEYVATLKGGVTKRATSSFHPGQLKKSIQQEVFADRVEIGVPSNIPAGRYAEKVHTKWNRTPHNTDPQVTEEFIFKAYTKNEKEIALHLDKVVLQIANEL